MASTVAVPVWLLVLLAGFALAGLLDRLLVPSVRWVLRRRVNLAIAEVNQRLRLKLPPFKLTKRDVLIDRLTYDPEVLRAVEAEVAASGKPHGVVMSEVEAYAREIVPAFNALIYFRVGYWIARRISELLYRVRVGYVDEAGLAQVGPATSVVFVMNHRSNVDYLLVSYLAADQTALSYAVGEWARVWPLQTLVRAMGAYFVRRNSGSALYRRVLERWVAMSTAAGVPQAVFPEGGLTRDGSLRPPKLGLLDYIVKTFDRAAPVDVLFIPVGINYDRVIEDRSLLLKKEDRRPGTAGAVAITGRALMRTFGQILTRRWFRMGYAIVNFGTPVSLRAFLNERDLDLAKADKDRRFQEVQVLAERLMARIGEIVPVGPVPLVASILDQAGGPVPETRLLAEAARRIEGYRAAGHHVYVPRADLAYLVSVGLRQLRLRRLVSLTPDGITIAPAQSHVVGYYAQSIAHLAVPRDQSPA